ncbi:AlkZ-related protein [Fusibacter sp. JL298sf-3]
MKAINDFNDFCVAMRTMGFSLSGDNAEGLFAVAQHYAPHIVAHTGDAAHDPWAWRIRAITETDDIAYGKVFLKKAGWVTRSWLSDFVCVRRGGQSMEALYATGHIDRMEKAVYDSIVEKGHLPLTDMVLAMGKTQKKAIEKALVALQMRFFITVYGETRKISAKGEPYGWPVAVYCTLEEKFGGEITEVAAQMRPEAAYERIEAHIRTLNPQADARKIKAFIKPYTF